MAAILTDLHLDTKIEIYMYVSLMNAILLKLEYICRIRMGREYEPGKTVGNSTDDSSRKKKQDAQTQLQYYSIQNRTGNVPTQDKYA